MLKLFAVRDVKADSYGNLICVATRGLALRSFSDACFAPSSPFASYPADFSLYEVGEYDPASGHVEGLAVPLFVASASDVIQSVNRVPKVVGEVKGGA